MAELFDVEEHTITYHIREIYKSGELEENPTTRKIRVVRTEGNRQVNREILFFNLDLVISVGYRVNSVKATQFRKFATRILHEYIQKKGLLLMMTDLRKAVSSTRVISAKWWNAYVKFDCLNAVFILK
jgi:hypothetical protein